ncbi:MAG: outer membrane beta-barrel family protein [Muribaculaceae bacterium]|nr:outer membrane beta-barrel family protein [Muribaculaceae bacterium]
MKKIALSLFVCSIVSQSLFANNHIVADTDTKKPVASAKVTVWLSDSATPMNLQSDMSGFVNIPDSATRILVKKFGYEDKEIKDYTLLKSDSIFLDLGYVLKEISVSPIKNSFLIKPDCYVYNVAADSALIGKSTFDALGRIPILNTTLDGSISSMQGKNLVYKVNGLTNPMLSGDLQTALRSLKAEHVKRIELRNDPNGSDPNTLEINIITKGRLEGYQANATSRLTDYGWRTSLWALTKINKFCVSGSYYYMLNRDHGEDTHQTELRETSDGQLKINKETSTSGYRAHFNNAELSMSYDIDDNTIISAYGRVLAKADPHTSSRSNTSIFTADASAIVAYQETGKTTFDDKEYSASLNFEKLYGENARNGKLFIGYDFYKRPNDSFSNVRYDISVCEDSLLLPALEQYDRREYVELTMHTAMIEYRRHFHKKHTLFANAKYRFRSDIDNDSLGSNIENVKLHQHLIDGSVAYKYAVEKFSIQGGIRANYYNDQISNSKFGSDYSYSRHNLIWQPSLSMAFVPNSDRRYELSYTMSSSIASISVMNPFVFQIEPTHISYGNPLVEPEKNQRLVFSTDFNFRRLYLSASLSGAHTSDIILQYSFVDSNDVLNTTYDNIASRWSYGVSTFLSWNITRKISLRSNLSLDYIDYASNRLGSGNSGLQFSGYINLSSELPFGIYGELRGSYNTPWINFQGNGGANYGYGISLMRSFLSNKLRLTLSAENFAPTYHNRTYTTTGSNFHQILSRRQFHASYAFSISYSFGNIRARVKETETSISNTDIKKYYDE